MCAWHVSFSLHVLKFPDIHFVCLMSIFYDWTTLGAAQNFVIHSQSLSPAGRTTPGITVAETGGFKREAAAQYSLGWIDSVTSPIKICDRTTKISDNITKYCVPTKVIVQCSPVLFCFRISCFGISFGFDLIFFHMCSQILFQPHPKVTLFWKDSLIGDIVNMNIYSLSRKYVKQDIPKETINTNKKDTKKDTCNHTVLTWHHEHCWMHA